jgi:hypothetical protein
MRLIQNGKEVSGIFAGGIGNSIEGSAEGRKLTFRTMEGDSRGEGWLELSRDGSSFSGQRRSGTDGAWKEVSGTRLMPETGITWLVVLEANWEESLSEAEYNFGDIIKSYFAGTPYVRVRHRRFANEDDLRYWLSEIPYLAEPTVVVVSSHGAADGIFGSADYKPIPASAFSDVLRYASNLKLLHLAACLTMKGDYSKKILKRVPADVRFPISGYATSVDWAGSALADLLYYEFVLGRGYEPQQAFNEILKLMPVAGKKSEKGAEIPALDMRIVMPRDVGR